MSALTFTLRQAPALRVDLSPLTPDLLAGRSAAEIAALPLSSGNSPMQVGDLFKVSGDDAGDIVFEGGSDRFDRIGQSMKTGSIRIHGDAGGFLGLGMAGGALRCAGSTGAYAGSAMRGGVLRIDGDAGDFLGAAIPGDMQGMRGGLLRVAGRAGDRAGDRMRRGALLIEGGAGAYAGSRMIAGTIAVQGPCGAHPGYGMRRGTIWLAQRPAAIPPTFNDSGVHTLPALSLLIRHWRATLDGVYASLPAERARARRLLGDRACAGLGEILLPA